MTTPVPLSPLTVDVLRADGYDDAGLAQVAALAAATLAEDLGDGVDVTSVATVPADLQGRAAYTPRAAGVLAGVGAALAVHDALQAVAGLPAPLEVRVLARDGDVVRAGEAVLEVTGPVRALLTAERSALNLLCHLSGVATLTRRWVDAVAGTGAAVRDTRKTMPGLRLLEKQAVRAGGGVNHRLGLWDAALVKDNHVVAAGGVAAAFDAVRRHFPGLPVEVECDTLAQVREVVAAGADLVLLDNMTLEQTREAVALCRAAGVLLEASGGLTLERAAQVAACGVDYLAVGALTHSAPVLDLGVDLTLGTTREV